MAVRRGVLVLRVSKLGARNLDDLHSFDDQEDDAMAFAERHQTKVVAKFEDLNQSGGTMDRPGMNAAVSMVLRGDADTIIVAKVDRFARNVKEGLRTLDEIEAVGGSVLCANLDVDTRTPVGRMTFINLLNIAEWERSEKRAGMARAAAKATRAGVRIGPPPPGYLLVGKRQLIRDDSDVLPEDDTRVSYAAHVATVFEMRAANASWSEIRSAWHGLTGELRSFTFFRRMIGNHAYYGELRHGDIVCDEPHDAIVDVDTWNAAQPERIDAPRPSRSQDGGTLLAGILVCGSCGRPMSASNARGRTMYRCKYAYRDFTCPQRVTVMASRADDYVVGQFLAWAGGITAVTTDDDADLAAAEANIAEATRRLRAFVDAFDAADVDPAILAPKASALQADIDAAVDARDRLKETRKVAGMRYVVREQWPNLTTAQKRQMLRAGIASVVVHPATSPTRERRAKVPVADRIVITWRQD